MSIRARRGLLDRVWVTKSPVATGVAGVLPGAWRNEQETARDQGPTTEPQALVSSVIFVNVEPERSQVPPSGASNLAVVPSEPVASLPVNEMVAAPSISD